MTDGYTVVGDALCVTHGPTTTRLSLVIPLETVDLWLEILNGSPTEVYRQVRDTIMPAEVRDFVTAIESVDGVRAIEAQTAWAAALSGRLGKALLATPSGDDIGPPSPPTSGSDGESVPTPPKRVRSTRARSSAT